MGVFIFLYITWPFYISAILIYGLLSVYEEEFSEWSHEQRIFLLPVINIILTAVVVYFYDLIVRPGAGMSWIAFFAVPFFLLGNLFIYIKARKISKKFPDYAGKSSHAVEKSLNAIGMLGLVLLGIIAVDKGINYVRASSDDSSACGIGWKGGLCAGEIAYKKSKPGICSAFMYSSGSANPCILSYTNHAKSVEDCKKLYSFNNEFAKLSRTCFEKFGVKFPESEICKSHYEKSNVAAFLATKCWKEMPIDKTFPGSKDTPLLAYLKTVAFDKRDNTVWEMKQLYPNLQLQDEHGRTALHLVRGVSDASELISSNINDLDFDKKTPPMYWVNNTSEYLVIIRSQKELMLSKGWNMNLQDINGDTILHLIARKARAPIQEREATDLINSLIQSGADPSIKNNQGQTVFEIYRR